jgi:hypothetical protein
MRAEKHAKLLLLDFNETGKCRQISYFKNICLILMVLELLHSDTDRRGEANRDNFATFRSQRSQSPQTYITLEDHQIKIS